MQKKIKNQKLIKFKFSDLVENIVEKIIPDKSGLDHYIGLKHLDSGSLKIKRYGETSSLIGDKLKIYKGDLIFAKRNAYLKRVAIADFDAVASAHSLVLRAKTHNILPDFLPYFLLSEKFWQKAIEISVGSLSPTINWKTLAEQVFFLPGIDEQKKITKLLNSINEMILNEDVLLEKIKIYYDAKTINLLNGHNLVKNKKNLPENWKLIKINELGLISTSSVDKKNRNNEKEINLINYMDVYTSVDKKIDSKIEFMKVTANSTQIKNNQVSLGDVLFNPSSETSDDIGHSAVVYENLPNTLYSYHLVNLKFKVKMDLEFKRFVFNNPEILNQFTRKSKGATRKILDLNDFRETFVRVPPINIQKKIADELSLINDSFIMCKNRISKSKMLQTSLINSLI